jgi:hypothetical protein
MSLGMVGALSAKLPECITQPAPTDIFLMAANRQAASIDALAGDAAAWVLALTPQQARRKAGMASKHFWLRKLLKNFWQPT